MFIVSEIGGFEVLGVAFRKIHFFPKPRVARRRLFCRTMVVDVLDVTAEFQIFAPNPWGDIGGRSLTPKIECRNIVPYSNVIFSETVTDRDEISVDSGSPRRVLGQLLGTFFSISSRLGS
jgi:hypothetical protein